MITLKIESLSGKTSERGNVSQLSEGNWVWSYG